MYEQVFNLTARPFTSSHYVKHYFAATAIDQSLQQCKMVIERAAGVAVVVGDHGTGKTLLLAMLEEHFKSQFRVVNISALLVNSRETLLQNILYQLQLNYRGLSENEMRLDLIEYLKSDLGNRILLMLDDAQKLLPEAIEEAQTLTDLVRDGQPSVRLVLAGSQGLEERLNDTRLASFNQRIAARCFLGCLSREETEAYVRTHLERAGGEPEKLFAAESWRAIHDVTEGRPRYINQVCDHAMIFSATRGVVPVTEALVREAWCDIQKLPGSVAPAGSGAALQSGSTGPDSVEGMESDGWTVLEFGQLSDSESNPQDALPEEQGEALTEAESTLQQGSVDRACLPEMIEETPVAEVPETAAAEEPVGEDQVQAQSRTLNPQSGGTRTVAGPSFSVGPTGEVQSIPALVQQPVDDSASSEVEAIDPATEQSAAEQSAAEQADTEQPVVTDALGGAAILASAMAGFGAANANAAEPVTTEPPSADERTFVEPENLMVPESLNSPPPAPAAEPELPVEVLATDPSVDSVQSADPQPAAAQFEDPFASDSFDDEEVLTDAYAPFVARQNQRSLEVTSEQLQDLTPEDVAPTVAASNEADAEEESFPTLETALQQPEPVREPVKPQYDPRDIEETRQLSDAPGPNSLSEEFLVNRNGGRLSDGDEIPLAAEQQVESLSLEPVEEIPGSRFVPLDPDAASLVDEAVHVEPSASLANQGEDLLSPPQPGAPLADDSALESAGPMTSSDAGLAEARPTSAEQPRHEVVATTQTPETVEPSSDASSQQLSGPKDYEADPVHVPASAQQPEPEVREPIEFHEQSTGVADPNVKRQAEEIIRSLASQSDEPADSISPESPRVPSSIQIETNAIEDTIQRSLKCSEAAAGQPEEPPTATSPPVVMPNIEALQESLRQAQARQGYPEIPPPQGLPETASVGLEEEVEPEQSILNEVLQQAALLPASLEPEAPTTPEGAQDDRDILEMKQPEEIAAVVDPTQGQDAELPEWSKQEPSQGEATRVDYQQLFDRLRNVHGNQEQ